MNISTYRRKLRIYIGNVTIALWIWIVHLLALHEFDKLVNALLGGDWREYLSSRIEKYTIAKQVWAIYLKKILHKLDRNHTEKSVQYDVGQDTKDDRTIID